MSLFIVREPIKYRKNVDRATTCLISINICCRIYAGPCKCICYVLCYSIYVLPDMDGFADFLPVASLLLLAGPVANLVWLLAGTVFLLL